MKQKALTTFLILILSIFPISAFPAAGSAGDANQYRLGVGFSRSLVSNKEEFVFRSGNERIVLNSANPVVYLVKRFAQGERYQVSQVSGPRACTFQGSSVGTFGTQDVILTVDCGQPPLTLFRMEVTGVEPGETFKFADNYNRTHSLPFSTNLNLGGFPQGDDYRVNQTDGPRQCRMSLNVGIVPTAPVTVKADCGKNPSTTPTPSSMPFKEFELVSRDSEGRIFGTFYEAFSPVIGGTGPDEGRFVAFSTYTKGLGGGSGKFRQVVWRDRKTGETRLVSTGIGGVEGNQNSDVPAISADGKSVAFESYATNLVPIDSNGVRDVFVWNYDTGRISAVSENRGIETNAEAFESSISGDGNLIAFSSSASTLTPGVDGTSTVNVYLRDMRSGAVTLISKDEKTGKGGGGSRPSISDDGGRIAFYNYFPLTKEDQNNLWDIYLWQNGKLKRISKTAFGGDKNQGEESSSRVVSATISGDGNFITFSTTATNMVGSDSAAFQDAFLVETNSGRVSMMSSAGGNSGNADSPFGQGEPIALTFDGRQAIFTSKAANLGGRLLLFSLAEGSNLLPIIPLKIDGVETSIGVPRISRGGKCVIFGSNAKLDPRFPSSGVFVTCR